MTDIAKPNKGRGWKIAVVLLVSCIIFTCCLFGVFLLGLFLGLFIPQSIVVTPKTTLAELRNIIAGCGLDCTLHFAPGRYYFNSSRPYADRLNMDQVPVIKTRTKFLGSGVDENTGTHFYYGNWFGGFQFFGGDVLVANLTVDLVRPHYTIVQPVTITTTQTTFSCHPQNGVNCRVPLWNETWVNGMDALYEWDIDNNRPRLSDYLDYYPPSRDVRISWIDSKTISIPVGSSQDIRMGRTYIIRHSLNRAPGFNLVTVGSSVFQDVRIYGAHGVAFGTANCRDLTFDRVKIMQRTPQVAMTSAADAFHIQGTHGNLIIQDCEATRQGDDGVNVYSMFAQISRVGADRRGIELSNREGKPGLLTVRGYPEAIEIFKRNTWEKVYSSVIIGSPELYMWSLRDPLPDSVKKWDLVSLPGMTTKSVLIRNSYFHENRGRGILLKASNALITGNRIERTPGAAFTGNVDSAYWFEGNLLKNVTLFNNTISGVAQENKKKFGLNAVFVTTLESCVYDAQGTPLRAEGVEISGGHTGHSGIVIDSNIVEHFGESPVINLYGVNGTVVKNNIIRVSANPDHFVFNSTVNVDASTNNACYNNGVLVTCKLITNNK